MALKQKIILFVFTLVACAHLALASSSTTFQADDESLNFAYNAGFLESATYSVDLAGITWVERNSESDSFILIDANSMLDIEESIVPPTPSTPPGGGGGNVGGGAALILPDYDEDFATIVQADILEDRLLNQLPGDELHEAAPEAEQMPMIIEEPIPDIKPAEEAEDLTFIFTQEDGFLYYETGVGLDDYNFITNENYQVAPFKLETPFEKDLKIEDGKVEIEGNAGKNYEVTAVWMGEDYISKSFATADENGKFIIKSSGELKDGEYFVLLYGLEKQKNKIIQTEYSTVKFNIVDGKSEVKIHCFRWDFIVLYIIIILITLYSIWRKEKK